MENIFVYLKAEDGTRVSLRAWDVGLLLREESGMSTVLFLRENIEASVLSHEVAKFPVEQVGDDFLYKVCDRCFRYLETSKHFQNNRHKKHEKITKRPSCRDCRKVKEGKSIKSKEREAWLARKPSDFSPFQCPICLKTSIVGIKNIVLDHCHRTGAVRGWICESCNTGIGRFDDDVEMVKRAIDWLEGRSSQRFDA